MISPTGRASAFPFSFPAAPTTAEAASIRIHGLFTTASPSQLGQDCYQGMTLLGGEPMEPVNQKGLLPLVKRFKETYPEKDLWCFSGYLFDKEILGHFAKIMPETMELLKYIDILVDGEFVLAKKDITLLFKGSSNQRTIDVQKSLHAGELCFWNPGDTSMSKMTKI